MYLLDTNAISEMRKIQKGKANPNFIAWLAEQDSSQFYTSVVVLMELERGILRMERKDPKQGYLLREWFHELTNHLFHSHVLPIDSDTAKLCAQMHIPSQAPENDAWIAATAKQHGLILVTRNIADFQKLGIELLNPFEPLF